MDATKVETALKNIIAEIQNNSGLECPPLTGTLVPAEEVPQFDSKVWIAATTMLAAKIGAEIPNDENIFMDKESKKALSLSEIAATVCKIASSNDAEEAAA
ncbi:hypothetical protein [Ponticaulis koreensis]|uniref:hypothetical protein n=1 Tax=Ponticaulis koreensis TaxID=1123045 RepID=UPI0003B528F7|nr:hypothetical protein [Ponticaulis koreensis]